MTTDFKTVQALAKQANIIPICHELPEDTETTISVLLKIREGAQHLFLLESVEGGERSGRYSFVGRDPFLTFRAKGNHITLEGETKGSLTGNPVTELKALFRRYQAARLPGLPAFTGGAVGYISYDAIRNVEHLPDHGLNELETEDIYFGFYDSFFVFDNLRHRLLLVANVRADLHPLEIAYDKACQRLGILQDFLNRPLDKRTNFRHAPGPVQSNMTQEQFENKVRACQEYIKAGDAFQIVLSQRFTLEDPGCDAMDIYRSLRMVNPSDYMYYLKFDGLEVAGASPELLVRVDADGTTQTRPIAGTRPRGATEAEDLKNERDLLADTKECAEHIMLVDLGRNDLGRVCKIGSVQPTELMAIRRYSHVMHIVSTVQGQLRPELDPLDALFSCFPAGTLSGAPKIRAMEIIDEQESLRRNVYGGSICYRDFSGNLDSCILIRTLIMKNGKAFVQAGAGIVADSNPTSEYEEIRHKAGAVLKALENVQQFSLSKPQGQKQ